MKNLKGTRNRGITLITMIVTIIVLIILAGVVLNLMIGTEGILAKAIKSVDDTEIANAQEEAEIWLSEIKAKYYEDKTLVKDMDDYIKDEIGIEGKITESGNKITIDKEGNISILNNKNEILSGKLEDGKVIWGEASTLVIPSDLEIGSIITWTPTGSYVWDKNLYASEEGGSYPNVYLASGNKADIEVMNARKAELTAKVNKSSEEIKELDALNNTLDMTITQWKVLSKTDNKLVILPDEPTISKPRLQGAQGYNNAIKLLNDACSSLYGSEKGVSARSINREDIEKTVIEVGNEDVLNSIKGANYDTYRDNVYARYKSYPEIWAEEKGARIDGKSMSGILGLSDQISFIEGTNQLSNGMKGVITAETDIQPKQTYYEGKLINLFEEKAEDNREIKVKKRVYLDLFNTMNNYWVASRCVNAFRDPYKFDVFDVYNGELWPTMIYSISGTSDVSYGFFPIVSLSSGEITKGGGDTFMFTSEE